MNADKIVRALKEMLPPQVDYAELVCSPVPSSYGGCYVWENPEPYHISAAIDLIESLQAQLAAKEAEIERLREAQRWRNAETEPPKCEDGAETGPILYRMKTTGTIEVGYYGRKGRWRDSYFRHMRNASDGVDADDVSDWMPLPAAPEEGAEK